MKPFISTAAIILGLASFSTAAQAEQVCMSADEMKAALIDWYGEQPVPGASDKTDEVWASPQTGTWTMFRTFSDGNACVLAQGDDWLMAPTDNELVAQLID